MCRELSRPVCLTFLALLLQAPAEAEQLPPAAEWIPREAIAVLELSQPKALLDLALDSRVRSAVTSLPAYRKQASEPGFQEFLGVIGYLENRLGTDWRTGIRKLLGGGVTFAAAADEAALLVVDAEDGRLLEQLHEILLGFARNEAEKAGQPERVASTEYRGVSTWTFGGDEAHAIVGRRLLLANKMGVLKAALDLRGSPEGEGLASMPAYQEARKAVGSEACGTAFLNLKAAKQAPGFQEALREAGNPLAALLFAGVTEALRGSSWLAAGLHVDQDALELKAVLDGKAVDPSGLVAAFAVPGKPGEGVLPNLSVPRRIAALTFYRDLHRFYAAKDDLFPERTSGLIFFENMMGIFFSGRDLTEDVLAEAKPQIRLVVAEQAYDPAVGTPRVRIPAFAAVFQLYNPKEFSEVAEEAWQKALGLINFTRGQQALPGLIIDRLVHNDVKFTMAYFSTAGIEDKTDLESRFNLRPALAVVEDYLILSSTEGLARDLIDALRQEIADSEKPSAGVHSLVEVDAVQVASILSANRGQLVRQNMINEGHTQEQAETQIDLLLTVLKYAGRARLDVGSHDGRPRASLELKLNLPRQ